MMNAQNQATIHGIPGERARATGVLRALGPLLIGLFVAGLCFGVLLPQIEAYVAGLGLLATSIFLMWAVYDGMRGIEAFFKGARGEERVACFLATLPQGYHVFHDFNCGGCCIDHVVVGTGGWFAIETKCWAGSVSLQDGVIRVNDGLPSREPLGQARASARALIDFIVKKTGEEYKCVSVVCFASDTFTPDAMMAEDTLICNASVLGRMIMTHFNYLSVDEVARIVKSMEHQ